MPRSSRKKKAAEKNKAESQNVANTLPADTKDVADKLAQTISLTENTSKVVVGVLTQKGGRRKLKTNSRWKQVRTHAVSWKTIFSKNPKDRSIDEISFAEAWLHSKKIKFLRDLNPTLVPKLASHFFLQEVEDQEIVVRQGDVGNLFYIIVQGQVGVRVKKDGVIDFSEEKRGLHVPDEFQIAEDDPEDVKDWKTQHISMLGLRRLTTLYGSQVTILEAGSVFGELGMQAQAKRSATCVSLGNTVMLTLDRDVYHALLKAHMQTKFTAPSVFFEKHDLTKMLDNTRRQSLLYHVTEKEFGPNQVLLKEGQEVKKVYFIKSGSCTLSQTVKYTVPETEQSKPTSIMMENYNSDLQKLVDGNPTCKIQASLAKVGAGEVVGLIVTDPKSLVPMVDPRIARAKKAAAAKKAREAAEAMKKAAAEKDGDILAETSPVKQNVSQKKTDAAETPKEDPKAISSVTVTCDTRVELLELHLDVFTKLFNRKIIKQIRQVSEDRKALFRQMVAKQLEMMAFNMKAKSKQMTPAHLEKYMSLVSPDLKRAPREFIEAHPELAPERTPVPIVDQKMKAKGLLLSHGARTRAEQKKKEEKKLAKPETQEDIMFRQQMEVIATKSAKQEQAVAIQYREPNDVLQLQNQFEKLTDGPRVPLAPRVLTPPRSARKLLLEKAPPVVEKLWGPQERKFLDYERNHLSPPPMKVRKEWGGMSHNLSAEESAARLQQLSLGQSIVSTLSLNEASLDAFFDNDAENSCPQMIIEDKKGVSINGSQTERAGTATVSSRRKRVMSATTTMLPSQATISSNASQSFYIDFAGNVRYKHPWGKKEQNMRTNWKSQGLLSWKQRMEPWRQMNAPKNGINDVYDQAYATVEEREAEAVRQRILEQKEREAKKEVYVQTDDAPFKVLPVSIAGMIRDVRPNDNWLHPLWSPPPPRPKVKRQLELNLSISTSHSKHGRNLQDWIKGTVNLPKNMDLKKPDFTKSEFYSAHFPGSPMVPYYGDHLGMPAVSDFEAAAAKTGYPVPESKREDRPPTGASAVTVISDILGEPVPEISNEMSAFSINPLQIEPTRPGEVHEPEPNQAAQNQAAQNQAAQQQDQLDQSGTPQPEQTDLAEQSAGQPTIESKKADPNSWEHYRVTSLQEGKALSSVLDFSPRVIPGKPSKPVNLEQAAKVAFNAGQAAPPNKVGLKSPLEAEKHIGVPVVHESNAEKSTWSDIEPDTPASQGFVAQIQQNAGQPKTKKRNTRDGIRGRSSVTKANHSRRSTSVASARNTEQNRTLQPTSVAEVLSGHIIPRPPEGSHFGRWRNAGRKLTKSAAKPTAVGSIETTVVETSIGSAEVPVPKNPVPYYSVLVARVKQKERRAAAAAGKSTAPEMGVESAVHAKEEAVEADARAKAESTASESGVSASMSTASVQTGNATSTTEFVLKANPKAKLSADAPASPSAIDYTAQYYDPTKDFAVTVREAEPVNWGGYGYCTSLVKLPLHRKFALKRQNKNASELVKVIYELENHPNYTSHREKWYKFNQKVKASEQAVRDKAERIRLNRAEAIARKCHPHSEAKQIFAELRMEARRQLWEEETGAKTEYTYKDAQPTESA